MEQNNMSEITSSLTYETTGQERLVTILYKKVEEMEKELRELKTQKIISETQLPHGMLAQNGLLPVLERRTKRGRGYRPLLQSEIEEARKHSIFAAGQARWLGVAHSTYRKYAKMYGIYDPKPFQKGRKQPHGPERGCYPLSKILNGDFNTHPKMSDWIAKRKIIQSHTFPECCDQCKYDKKSIIDNHVPLLLDHLDGDKKNFKKENLRLLCWNCTIECGRGYLRRGVHMFDPGIFK